MPPDSISHIEIFKLVLPMEPFLIAFNTTLKSAFDMALHDLAAKTAESAKAVVAKGEMRKYGDMMRHHLNGGLPGRMGFLFPAVLLAMAIGVHSQTLEDSAGFAQADSFFQESQAKQRFPKFSVEAEPLRTLLWWGASNLDETETDTATGKDVRKKEFPTVSPVVVVTRSLNKTWSVMGTYLLDFQNQGGWGLGAGVNMSQSDEYLRGIYYGGKVYFLNLADYGYSFRAYGEIGSRILILKHLSVGIGTAIGYGNNAIDESEGATLGIIGELHVRAGFWF